MPVFHCLGLVKVELLQFYKWRYLIVRVKSNIWKQNMLHWFQIEEAYEWTFLNAWKTGVALTVSSLQTRWLSTPTHHNEVLPVDKQKSFTIRVLESWSEPYLEAAVGPLRIRAKHFLILKYVWYQTNWWIIVGPLPCRSKEEVGAPPQKTENSFECVC